MSTNKIKEKIIELDNPKSVELKSKNFLLDSSYLGFATDLIKARVKEIKEYIGNSEKDNDREYIQLRMHDMIMVAGRRGSGKTTFLMNLRRKIKDNKHLQKDVKVLDIIDPTLLHGNSDILLLILAGVYTKVSNDFKKEQNKTEKKNQFNTIKDELQNLHRTINLAYKFKKDEDLEEDNYERLFGLHKGLEIDKDLHKFFKLVCDYYKVKALVLPIDDIDMDFKYGYKVFDTIRKYLATPRVLPISSMDIQQAHSLIKKEQYEYFGYNANTSKYTIKEDSELKFLRKLPEEFLTKISLPTRRIILPDMLSIFEKYIDHKNKFKSLSSNEKKDSNFKYIYFQFTNSYKIKFKIELEEIVKLYLNVVYDANINRDYRLKKISSSDYLGNKSIRSFFEDIRAFLNCIVKNKTSYKFDKKPLIRRYLPYSTVKYKTKYDAALGLWSSYIKLTNNQINNNIHTFNNTGRSYQISGKDHDNTVKTKTYMRLFLQDFFIDNVFIELRKEDDKFFNIKKINKKINIAGAMELAIRTFIPQYLFESIYKSSYKDMGSVNIKELESFATDDLKVISTKLSMMNIDLLNDANSSNIMGGIRISANEYNALSPISSFLSTEQSTNLKFSYLSAFKAILLNIELLNAKNSDEVKSIIFKYFRYKKLNNGVHQILMDAEVDKCILRISKVKNIIDYNEIGFGLNELSNFSKKFIDNIHSTIDLNKIVRNSEDTILLIQKLLDNAKSRLSEVTREINDIKNTKDYITKKENEEIKYKVLEELTFLEEKKEKIEEEISYYHKEASNMFTNPMAKSSIILSKQKEFSIYYTSFFNHFLIEIFKANTYQSNNELILLDDSSIKYGVSTYDRQDYWEKKLQLKNHPLSYNISLIANSLEMTDFVNLIKKIMMCSTSELLKEIFE